jgi:uncharacterized protein (DUF4415 family)
MKGKNMRQEYDFSKGKRGAVIPGGTDVETRVVGKTRITTYLDADIVEWLKTRGEEEHKGYQTVLNELLRKQLAPEPPLAEVVRQVIREELKKVA